ncbi:hypothetical protein [Bacillus sp. RC250]|uniref:hypothetical protein n=1 Tax=Bacillus sp. RC250 TaxID=3156287 RepID=UPI003839ABDB
MFKSSKKFKRTAASDYKYIFSERGMEFTELLNKIERTMLTSEAIINRSTHVVKDEKDFDF